MVMGLLAVRRGDEQNHVHVCGFMCAQQCLCTVDMKVCLLGKRRKHALQGLGDVTSVFGWEKVLHVVTVLVGVAGGCPLPPHHDCRYGTRKKAGPGGVEQRDVRRGVQRGAWAVTWQVSTLPSGYPAHTLVERMRPPYHCVELHRSRSMSSTRASCSTGDVL